MLCKMCSFSCGRCDTTTPEPTTAYKTTMTTIWPMFGRPFARSADLSDSSEVSSTHGPVSPCELEALDNPDVKCLPTGLYYPMQCLPVKANDGAESSWDLEICYCVDQMNGEKIPLTEKAVLGDQDKPNCETVPEEEPEPEEGRVF